MARILLVDDNDDLRSLLLDALAQAKHDVTPASSGPDALGHMNGSQFDLLITDMLLPGYDGSEVIRRFEAVYPSGKVMAISGNGNLIEAARRLDQRRAARVTEFLAKPFRLQDFRGAVARLLSE